MRARSVTVGGRDFNRSSGAEVEDGLGISVAEESLVDREGAKRRNQNKIGVPFDA